MTDDVDDIMARAGQRAIPYYEDVGRALVTLVTMAYQMGNTTATMRKHMAGMLEQGVLDNKEWAAAIEFMLDVFKTKPSELWEKWDIMAEQVRMVNPPAGPGDPEP